MVAPCAREGWKWAPIQKFPPLVPAGVPLPHRCSPGRDCVGKDATDGRAFPRLRHRHTLSGREGGCPVNVNITGLRGEDRVSALIGLCVLVTEGEARGRLHRAVWTIFALLVFRKQSKIEPGETLDCNVSASETGSVKLLATQFYVPLPRGSHLSCLPAGFMTILMYTFLPSLSAEFPNI
ncbi:hypothetical protein PGT21_029520 [Puccinia graminis f. sp. tritici]|uniref:Uncharacterized protein n=1 Tax=Puccinia graminis f. sp. tritici TaxID=56615 RepID=A0A5B0RSP4_PUCGR|nr:hypothetical protein PGT21_029520 [Puccinia graminis f. sp. tritici]KAA1128298.1 hypothetical protein PGTUg99_000719 [Puccinia graminis f. sp. tritici]